VDGDALRARRAAAQLLHRPPGDDPAAVAGALLAVQAQDLRAARLTLRARAASLTAAGVDRALEERSVVVTWLMRGTLHLVRAEDEGWLRMLTAPRREATHRRRLAQEGVTPEQADRAVAVIEAALRDEGPLVRAELGERVTADGIRAEGQALPHLLGVAAARGIAVLGPVREDGHAFVFRPAWIGEPDLPDRPTALADLARRYLRGHGPAGANDLATWSGLPLRDARAGLAAIAASTEEAGGDLVDLADRERPEAEVAPRLLGAFDPWLLGWKDRSLVVPKPFARRVHPGGGIVRAVATAGGEAVGTWTARRRDGRLAVAVEPFASLSHEVAGALHADAADVARFEGLAAAD
jgi:Winged helix DNA-binding domain